MELNTLQNLASRTLPKPGAQHWFDGHGKDCPPPWASDYVLFLNRHHANLDLLHAALGMSGEVGELIDTIKKCMFYGKLLNDERRANLIEEGGDVVWYIAGPYCRALGVTFEQLCLVMVNKLRLRYPEGYTDLAATERADKVNETETLKSLVEQVEAPALGVQEILGLLAEAVAKRESMYFLPSESYAPGGGRRFKITIEEIVDPLPETAALAL